MKKNIAIIILSVIILILGGYLVYNKFINKNDQQNSIIESENKNNESLSLVTDFVNGKVIQTYSHPEGANVELFENEIPYVEVTLPYINIDSQAANEINNKIQTKFSEEINIIKNNITEQVSNKGPYYTVINYSYTVKNNVLFISIKRQGHAYRASGSVEQVVYYYDLENNKQLSTKEIFQKFVNENSFYDTCSRNYLANECNIDVLGDSIMIIPTGSYIYIESMEMGTFNPFYCVAK